jgi:hypothetical protein
MKDDKKYRMNRPAGNLITELKTDGKEEYLYVRAK